MSDKKEEVKKTEPKNLKKVKQAVVTPVKTKKKGEFQKFVEVFVADDLSNIGSYIFRDVLVPTIQNTIIDAVTGGVNMLFGRSARTGGKPNAYHNVSYTNYSTSKTSPKPVYDSGSRRGYDYEDITLRTRGDAEELLTRMDELIETYGMVSVGDLYDLVDKTGNYTDYKYGWTNIRDASVERARDGYVLRLPKAIPLN
jgi:hypothetical protein